MTTAPSRQAMRLSAALRQAAIDLPRDLPPGVHLTATYAEHDDAQAVITVTAKDAYGAAMWEQRYDGSGRQISVHTS